MGIPQIANYTPFSAHARPNAVGTLRHNEATAPLCVRLLLVCTLLFILANSEGWDPKLSASRRLIIATVIHIVSHIALNVKAFLLRFQRHLASYHGDITFPSQRMNGVAYLVQFSRELKAVLIFLSLSASQPRGFCLAIYEASRDRHTVTSIWSLSV